MPQLAEVSVVTSVVAMDEMSWSTVGGHKIGAWFASLSSRGRGRRKAAAVAAAAANNTGAVNNNTTRSFTLGKPSRDVTRWNLTSQLLKIYGRHHLNRSDWRGTHTHSPWSPFFSLSLSKRSIRLYLYLLDARPIFRRRKLCCRKASLFLLD